MTSPGVRIAHRTSRTSSHIHSSSCSSQHIIKPLVIPVSQYTHLTFTLILQSPQLIDIAETALNDEYAIKPLLKKHPDFITITMEMLVIFFFFLMIRPPPNPTLFPTTTLSR